MSLLKGNRFTCAADVKDINALITLAGELKGGRPVNTALGAGKTVGLLFFNPSLRTRVSTQLAAKRLGLDSIVLNVDKDSWAIEFGEGAVMNGRTTEHIKDAAPVMAAYFSAIGVRAFPKLESATDDYAETMLNAFIKYSNVPVFSLESATRHPLQSLADMLTMQEVIREEDISHRPKAALVWAPHVKALPQCVANSFAEWTLAWGHADLVIAQPEGMELGEEFTRGAKIVYDKAEALENADFVYVKNWCSYRNYGFTPQGMDNWMLREADMAATREGRLMHCLPARRNVEVSDELMDGRRSLVTRQAENRVYSAQAVLHELLKY